LTNVNVNQITRNIDWKSVNLNQTIHDISILKCKNIFPCRNTQRKDLVFGSWLTKLKPYLFFVSNNNVKITSQQCHKCAPERRWMLQDLINQMNIRGFQQSKNKESTSRFPQHEHSSGYKRGSYIRSTESNKGIWYSFESIRQPKHIWHRVNLNLKYIHRNIEEDIY
jgi:hypothetical protein